MIYSVKSNLLSLSSLSAALSFNDGEDIVRQNSPHIYDELANIAKVKKMIKETDKSPVKYIQKILKKNGWKTEWPILNNKYCHHRSDAYKDRIVIELEFSNRDICFRDFCRFKKLIEEKKIDTAVLITYADIKAVTRWNHKSEKEKGSTPYLTLEWLRDSKIIEEYKYSLTSVPLWCIGID